MDQRVNVAARLTAMAESMPDATAVVEPLGYDSDRKRRYRQISFRELDQDSDRIARGLRRLGATPGTRLALLVRPSIDFISLVFGLFKSGAVTILIDPGMGRRNLIQCLCDAQPEGFVAIPPVHAVRTILRHRFPKARLNVTVGRRWFWGGVTLKQLRGEPWDGNQTAATGADDAAAIIFTTGSTGPPKGVLYRHGNFDGQVQQIQEQYGIQPGEIDLPGFPLFGLFNCAMGVTTVIPDMDPSRPAEVSPPKIIEAIHDWNVTQAFGSPAIWDRVGRYCVEQGIRLPTIRRVLSAGAPVPADVLRRMKETIHADGDVHTPYGATESLPVASIRATEVLGETAQKTNEGAGVCVGKRFSGIRWKVVRIVDGPIRSIEEADSVSPGEIGELIVQGPVVTREYCTRTESNALGKIPDGNQIWHRMGDTGYFDSQQRFWVCGRMAHRVVTAEGTMFTLRCEALFNCHELVRRSALVGIGTAGSQRPVLIIEPVEGSMPATQPAKESLLSELRHIARSNPLTERIDDFLFHPAFPVDVRHNAKIFREKLAVWAAAELAKS